MISFDASEIANWSDKPDAHHQLPELIRRLILATVPMPSLLDMASGSSVQLPGWDGLLVIDHGNALVPDGVSAWEFSCKKGPDAKATADYEKRTADSKGAEVATTTYVSVTSRVWTKRRTWVDKPGSPWADVRALDAGDLAAWPDRAPAVARWFARLIGKLPATGVVSLDEW